MLLFLSCPIGKLDVVPPGSIERIVPQRVEFESGKAVQHFLIASFFNQDYSSAQGCSSLLMSSIRSRTHLIDGSKSRTPWLVIAPLWLGGIEPHSHGHAVLSILMRYLPPFKGKMSRQGRARICGDRFPGLSPEINKMYQRGVVSFVKKEL